MNYKPIILVAGEPNSIFFEILFKVYKKIKIKSPLILIASQKLLYLQMKKLNFKKKIKVINQEKIKDYKLNNDSINLINVDYDQKKAFEKISNKSNEYIKKCFDIAIALIKSDFSNRLINGPISKKNFLKKKFMGITELFAKKFNQQKVAMLIYNKELSVSPITTHLPIKNVASKITKASDYLGSVKHYLEGMKFQDVELAVVPVAGDMTDAMTMDDVNEEEEKEEKPDMDKLLKALKKKLSDVKIVIEDSNDPRSYRQCSDKLLNLGFKPLKNVDSAIDEIITAFRNKELYDGEKSISVKNLKTLKVT